MDTIDRIIALEWEMFGRVQNIGGRAHCQDDFYTFARMRRSQFEVWDDETRDSYLSDLRQAKKERRNLLSEKYAYMMRYTAPEEFAALAHRLPPLSPEKEALIEDITRAHLDAYADFARRYPLAASLGRPPSLNAGTVGLTSLDAYLRGELATYSLRTLQLYRNFMYRYRAGGQNIAMQTIALELEKYGCKSLEALEEIILHSREVLDNGREEDLRAHR
ncbi:MAG: DUF4125 family protein [Gracilibacteraceae bacterium]|jgi:hypothetical protein|nr:DUF4125 family protein [Gracilibacteraceae bacterium]